MEEAQKIIEQWLTETRSRELYETSDINDRLNGLTEMITDQECQNIMLAWREALSLDQYYSSARVADNLLDMWGCVSRALAIEVEV